MSLRSISDLSQKAAQLASQIEEVSPSAGEGNHQGSAHRDLPEDLRRAFIDLRSDLMEMGINDPLLVRFDTATVAQATNGAIAERLRQLGQSLSPADVPPS